MIIFDQAIKMRLSKGLGTCLKSLGIPELRCSVLSLAEFWCTDGTKSCQRVHGNFDHNVQGEKDIPLFLEFLFLQTL